MLQDLRDQLSSEMVAILAQWGYEEEDTTNLIEINEYEDSVKDLVATPIAYRVAAAQNKSPANVAEDLANALRDRVSIPEIERIETVSGYINFHVATDEFTTQVLDYILDVGTKYGGMDESVTRAVWDFASPNIGKQLHIGHLRNAVLGDVLGNILETQGYDLIRINWLGDWGIQFSHLLHQFDKAKENEEYEEVSFEFLTDLYQRSSRRKAELENTGCEDELEQFHNTVRTYFAQLEDGDEAVRRLWRQILTKSSNQLKDTYNRLGITFDIWTTESTTVLEKRTDQIMEMVQDQDSVVEADNGAYIIPIHNWNIDDSNERDWRTEHGEFVLIKADGTTTYEMRDLASIVYRIRNLDVTEIFYVVGNDHHGHFKKLFTIVRKLGYTDRQFTHIDYGPVDLSDGPMATRDGRVITINEVLFQIYGKAITRVRANNPSLDEERISEIAEKIAVGTLRFYAMFRHRTKNLTFDMDEVTALTGETASYIQYAATRGLSILSNVNEVPDPVTVSDQPFNEYDYRLAVRLARYPLVLERCKDRYDTTPLAQYLLDLARTFHRFYHENRVLDAKQARERRLVLVAATIQVFENAFEIAGIPLLQRM